jgi:hypothetical protein
MDSMLSDTELREKYKDIKKEDDITMVVVKIEKEL